MKKKVTVADICKLIEDNAPKAYAEEWDNVGLQVGELNQEVEKILISLDFTEEVLEEAIEINADMIVSHHPFLFRSLKNITTATKNTELLIKAIKNNISIYAAHTNLDNINDGLNWIVANKLELEDIEPLEPTYRESYKLITFVPYSHLENVRTALFKAGAGSIGNYDYCSYTSDGYGTFRGNSFTNPFVGEQGKLHTEAEQRLELIVPFHTLNKVVNALHKTHPYEEPAYDIIKLMNKHKLIGSGTIGNLKTPITEKEFLQKVKTVLNTTVIRHSQLTNNQIKRVALCTGSGSFLTTKAIIRGADAFVTGDMKYHDFDVPEKNILLIDAGHYETEIFAIDWFKEKIANKYNEIDLITTKHGKNFINYLL